MPVIEGGIVISGGVVDVHTGPRVFVGHGVPTGATHYVGMVVIGDLYIDHDDNRVYEYTEPAAVPTYTRIDTVAP
jgi:hypothetical protein